MCTFTRQRTRSRPSHDEQALNWRIPSQYLSSYSCRLTRKIGDDCWIGGNVTILAGVTIGKGCVIGAGSIVTNDVEDYSVAVGNPARIIKKVGPPADET